MEHKLRVFNKDFDNDNNYNQCQIRTIYIMYHTAVDQGQEMPPPHSLECDQVGLSNRVFLQRLHEQIAIQNVLFLLV